jgi:hypothetical protein
VSFLGPMGPRTQLQPSSNWNFEFTRPTMERQGFYRLCDLYGYGLHLEPA